MKKVLVVINTMGRAGAERALISMLKSFDYSNTEVSLLSIIGRGEIFPEVPEQVRILNKKTSSKTILGLSGALHTVKLVLTKMPVKAINYIPFAVKYNNTRKSLRRRFQADKLLWFLLADGTPVIDEEFDLAISYIEGAASYYVADKVNARKKILFIHINYKKAEYIKSYDFPFFDKMDYIPCISNGVREVFENIYPEFKHKTRLFPNIMLPEDILKKATEEGGFKDDFDGFRLLTVGRLHYQKGYDIAIATLEKLVKQGYDNVRWYILGEGSERSKLEKLIKHHNLEGKFVLLGSDPNPYTYMEQCDIYLQPSRYEGFPLTLAEALILGKPCISSDFDGVRDHLTDGENAIITELLDDNIAEAIKKLLSDKSLSEQLSEGAKKLDFCRTNRVKILENLAHGEEWEE